MCVRYRLTSAVLVRIDFFFNLFQLAILPQLIRILDEQVNGFISDMMVDGRGDFKVSCLEVRTRYWDEAGS